MNYMALWVEFSINPLGVSYKKPDGQWRPASIIADYLHSEAQEVARTSLTPYELWENTDLTEYKALSVAERDAYWGIMGLDSIDVTAGTNSRAALSTLFPGGSVTRDNLIALLTTPLLVTRVSQLGLGEVVAAHVEKAIAQGERGDFD